MARVRFAMPSIMTVMVTSTKEICARIINCVSPDNVATAVPTVSALRPVNDAKRSHRSVLNSAGVECADGSECQVDTGACDDPCGNLNCGQGSFVCMAPVGTVIASCMLPLDRHVSMVNVQMTVRHVELSQRPVLSRGCMRRFLRFGVMCGG